MKIHYETQQQMFYEIAIIVDQLFNTSSKDFENSIQQQQQQQQQQQHQLAKIRVVKNDQEEFQNLYTNYYHCALRISLCARRITMVTACGMSVMRFWLGTTCRKRNYHCKSNFRFEGPPPKWRFTMEQGRDSCLNVFDRACPVNLIQEILQNNYEGNFDHTIRIIIFRNALKEVIDLRTRIQGTVATHTQGIAASSSITSMIRRKVLNEALLAKPLHWTSEFDSFVLIGLETPL